MANDEIAPAPVGSKVGRDLVILDSVVMPETMGGMIDFAQLMCKAGVALPAHLRNNPGACLAVSMRSRSWRMDPFAVATKTYSVNDILAYESQLITAVINRNAPIKGRLVPRYTGAGDKRQCILEPETIDGQKLPYESPPKGEIRPQNSPLWKSDPDQQLFYYSSRAWARRYFPELLLGVYDPEEVRASAESMKDVTPKVDNYLHDEHPAEPAVTLNGTVVMQRGEPVHAGDVPEQVTIDAETGEILEEEDEKPDPALIAKNLAKAAGSFSSLALFESWLEGEREAIELLPEELRGAVENAINQARNELEGL